MGEPRKSRELIDRARIVAQQNGFKEPLVAISNGQAQFEADLENNRETRALADLSLRESPSSARHRAFATLALARAGDTQCVEALLNELNKQPTPRTALKEVVLPSICAAIDLDRKHPAQAVEELRRAFPYDLGGDSRGSTLYYRGLAYLELKEGKDAAAQFQTILDNRGVVTIDVYWPLAHVEGARAYAQTGDTDRSLAMYRELFSLWKNADRDLRPFKEAKAEHKKTQRTLSVLALISRRSINDVGHKQQMASGS